MTTAVFDDTCGNLIQIASTADAAASDAACLELEAARMGDAGRIRTRRLASRRRDVLGLGAGLAAGEGTFAAAVNVDQNRH